MTGSLTPDPDALPFLVVHGGWFWIINVTVLAATLLALAALIRHVRELVRSREIIARLRRDVAGTLTEGPIVLAGRWCGDAVEVGGERVDLDDTMRIVLEGRRGGRIAAGAGVVVTGRLSRTAVVDREASYRLDAGTWRLADAQVYAVKPRVRARRLALITWFPAVFIIALVSYVASLVLGKMLVDDFDDDLRAGTVPGDGRPLEIGDLHVMAIAAALPGSRDDALRLLSKSLEHHRFRDERSVRRQLALADLGGDKCDGAGILADLGRYDEALALARRCGDLRLAYELLIRLGDYEAAWASRAPEVDMRSQGMIAIAIGNWATAATIADRVAARETESATVARFRCLAQWFRSLADDAGALETLRTIAVGRDPVACAPMIAQTLAPDARIDFLLEARRSAWNNESIHLTRSWSVMNLMLWFADGDRTGPAIGLLKAIGEGSSISDEWIALSEAEGNHRSDRDARIEVQILAAIATREVHRGEFAVARSLGEEARAVARVAESKWAEDNALDLFAAIALRDGTIELPAPGDADQLVSSIPVRRGRNPRHGLSTLSRECASTFELAVAEAQNGDGTSLARAMQSCRILENDFTNSMLLGVLPLVQRGRAELQAAIAWWDHEPRSHTVFDVVAYSAVRRDIARLAGDTAGAERWGRIARRAVAPLDDPDRVLALVLWTD